MKLPVRQPVARGAVRATGRSRGAPVVRVVGLVLAIAAGAGMYWATRATVFTLDPAHVRIVGLVYTDEQQLRQEMGLASDASPNVFRLQPAHMAEALRGLPSVESADVVVTLPDRLDITVHERQPLLIWRTPNSSLLADASGALLAVAPPDSTLPALQDQRATAAALHPGDRLDETDMAAARLLLTITPADLDSSTSGLSLFLDDQNGWYMTTSPPAWRAIFGFYTANQLRPQDRVPRQRQCLESLLAARNEQPATIYLAVDGDRCGTYRDEPTPAAYSGQNVGARAP